MSSPNFLKINIKEKEWWPIQRKKIVAIEEKLFLHDEMCIQIWFVGVWETDTLKLD